MLTVLKTTYFVSENNSETGTMQSKIYKSLLNYFRWLAHITDFSCATLNFNWLRPKCVDFFYLLLKKIIVQACCWDSCALLPTLFSFTVPRSLTQSLIYNSYYQFEMRWNALIANIGWLTISFSPFEYVQVSFHTLCIRIMIKFKTIKSLNVFFLNVSFVIWTISKIHVVVWITI